MRFFITFLATGGYLGKIPLAPGTFGSVAGVLLYFLVYQLPPLAYLAMVVAFVFFAAWVATGAQQIFSAQDPREVVIDEIAGFLVTMTFHPFEWSLVLGGFLLFRVFDVVKPPPCKWLERYFLDGWGVVLDDVMAGIYANIALWCFGLLLPNFGKHTALF